MKRLMLLLALIGVAGPPVPASSYFLSPDVPTDDPGASSAIFMPWDIVWNQAGAYTLVASLPAGTDIDSLHQMCTGDWLFSVEVPTELPPGGGVFFLPGDVIHYDGTNYTLYFGGAASGLPRETNVDAAFLNGGDSAPLILSFDVPTTIGATTYEPADLVQYLGAGAYAIFLDASATAPPIPLTDNVTAADHRILPVIARSILSFDVPTSISIPDFLPGESVSWDGALFSSFYLDPNWVISSRLDALSLPADPGRVPQYAPPSLLVSKAASFPPNLDLTWWPSTSAGANDYAIYEGNVQTLAAAYNHAPNLCSTGGATSATIAPAAGDRYFLVVPMNDYDEGSYGKDNPPPPALPSERPQGSPSCRPFQAFGCP